MIKRPFRVLDRAKDGPLWGMGKIPNHSGTQPMQKSNLPAITCLYKEKTGAKARPTRAFGMQGGAHMQKENIQIGTRFALFYGVTRTLTKGTGR